MGMARRNRKMQFHLNRSVLFVTLALEQGLLLLNNSLGKEMIASCLARAQELYPVILPHIIAEGSHLHLVMVVENPEHVPAFIRHFKTESAHYLNRLLGRRKRTIWCEGSDTPIVLSYRRALIAIAYLYSNPAKDNLTENIDSYPGFSTWKMFTQKRLSRKCKLLSRPLFTPIPRDAQNLRGYEKRAEEISRKARGECTLIIQPNAWMDAFGITDPLEQERINQKLIQRVRLLEKRAADTRTRLKKSVIGRERLRLQRFDLSYLSPRRNGKRMWCLSEKRHLRVAFIAYFKDLMAKARAVRQLWAQGDFSVPYPPGLHPPSVPRLANIWPSP